MGAERLGAALDLEPFQAADQADDHGGERRLDHAGHEMLEIDHVAQLVEIVRSVEAEHGEGHQPAAGKAHQVADER